MPAPDPADVAAVRRQLGRVPRGVAAIAHRCSCGDPDVVATEPRLPDGTPFPTLYYLTCPRAAGLIGTLEADGVIGPGTIKAVNVPVARRVREIQLALERERWLPDMLGGELLGACATVDEGKTLVAAVQA